MTMALRDSIAAMRAGRRRLFRAALGVVSIVPLLAACAIATPYEATSAASATDAGGAIIIVVTEATLAPDSAARDAFWEGVDGVRAVLSEQPGLVGYSMRQELFGDRTWTMTEWRSEAALEAFVRSPAHQRAMSLGSEALAGVRFARLTRPADASPLSWAEAVEALEDRRYGYE